MTSLNLQKGKNPQLPFLQEVHCIVLTDILLLCKLTRGSQLKIIRPPYQVHRLLFEELARDTPTLAIVHLSEYSTPVAAFLLTSPDQKTIKVC